MAIIWEAPERPVSLADTPADTAWRIWLVQALASAFTEASRNANALVPARATLSDSAALRLARARAAERA